MNREILYQTEFQDQQEIAKMRMNKLNMMKKMTTTKKMTKMMMKMQQMEVI